MNVATIIDRPHFPLHRAGTTALFVAMELAYLLPVVALIRAVSGVDLPGLLPGLAAVQAAGVIAAALALPCSGRPRLWLGLLVAGGMAAVALLTAVLAPPSWGAAILPVALGGVLWIRGTAVGTRLPGFTAFAFGFQTGLVLLLVTLALAGIGAIALPAAPVQAAAFLAAGLTGLGWTRRDAAAPAADEAAGEASAAAARGLAMPLGAAALVILLGLGVWSLVDRGLVDLLLAAVLWVAARLHALLAWIVSLFPAPEPFEAPPPAMPAAGAMSDQTARQGQALPNWIREGAHWMMVLGGTYIVGTIVLSYLRELLAWLAGRAHPTPGLERGRTGGLLRDLGLLVLMLRRLIARLAARLGLRRGDDGSVRGLYRSLLAWAEARGLGRSPAETAAAHAERLGRALPPHGHDLAAIAAAYMPVRYGGRAESAADLDDLRARWHRLAADDTRHRSPESPR